MHEFIELAIENSKQALVIITNHFSKGLEPTIAYANKEFLNTVDYSLDDIINHNPNIIFHANKGDNFVAELKEHLMNAKSWEGPIVLQDKHKNDHVLYFNIIPVYNTINEILYYACFGQPIDGAETVNNQHVGCKHLENFLGTLFAQTNYFQEISSHIPTGMWRIDKKMNIVYANNVAASKFNLKADTNLLDHVMHSEHRYIKNMLKSCSPENLIHKMTFRVIAADTIIWAGCDFWPIVKDGKIEGFAGTIQDVTNEQILVKQLQVLRAK